MLGLSRLTIKTRIYAGFGILMMLGLAVSISGVWQLSTVTDNVKRLTGISDTAGRITDISRLLEVIRRAGLTYKTTGDEAQIKVYEAAQGQAIDFLTAIAKVTTSEERLNIYKSVEDSLQKFRSDFDKLVKTSNAILAGSPRLSAAGGDCDGRSPKFHSQCAPDVGALYDQQRRRFIERSARCLCEGRKGARGRAGAERKRTFER
jgi:hypothetical protein